MQFSDIDNGKTFDWGNTSKDYAKYRDIYPDEFYQFILDLGLCKDGQKVLDIGTGTGVLPRNMHRYGAKWIGTDISENQIEQAKLLASEKGMDIEFYSCPAEKVDYPDNTFDVITVCQCIWYLDAKEISKSFARMLKPGGKLLILYMGWLPYEDPVAGKSEEIILKHNPNWSSYGDTVHPVFVPEELSASFDKILQKEFRVDIPFTREGWHGRMRACRGVGAAMNEAQLHAWNEDHMQMLNESAPEVFNVKHYVSVAELQVKSMLEKIYLTEKGPIHYWISSAASDGPSLVFLPGLSADHRLFEKQTDCFNGRYHLFVWDAPGHASSYPFQMDFTLADKAMWLNEILEREDMNHPIIIGQSMGGYVGQMYAQLYPEKLRGFISIDSAPLQRQYLTGIELWLLKRMEPVYRHYPWKLLLKQGTNGVAVSEYGRSLMHSMMMTYDGDQKRYAELAGHGYRILAEAIEEDLPYEIKCPALLICGDKDHAGSCIRYNKKWHKISGIKIEWINGAGHNSNTDEPEQINKLIDSFVNKIKK